MEVTVGDWPYPWALDDTGIDWMKRWSIGPSLCLMLSVRQTTSDKGWWWQSQLWKQSGKGKSASLLRRLWCRTVSNASEKSNDIRCT